MRERERRRQRQRKGRGREEWSGGRNRKSKGSQGKKERQKDRIEGEIDSIQVEQETASCLRLPGSRSSRVSLAGFDAFRLLGSGCTRTHLQLSSRESHNKQGRSVRTDKTIISLGHLTIESVPTRPVLPSCLHFLPHSILADPGVSWILIILLSAAAAASSSLSSSQLFSSSTAASHKQLCSLHRQTRAPGSQSG